MINYALVFVVVIIIITN